MREALHFHSCHLAARLSAAAADFRTRFHLLIVAELLAALGAALTGVGANTSSGIPINTLYAVPNLASPSASSSRLLTTGNNDVLYVLGWLDLSKGPQVLHVPDMAGRYYSVQFTDRSDGTNFAYVGRRTTGTQAGYYLITGPNWQGVAPSGMTQISSPNNSVLVIGRVLVESDSDLSTAYNLTKQIQLTPLNQR